MARWCASSWTSGSWDDLVMSWPGDECRSWAIEAIRSGLSPTDVVAELRLRRGLPPIHAIKILREAAGISLADAKSLVDQTMSPEFIASRDELVDDLVKTWMAELAVAGARVTLSRLPDGGQWTFTLNSDGDAVGTSDYLVGADTIDDAQESATAVIDRLSRRHGVALTVAWSENKDTNGSFGLLELPVPDG